MEYGHSHQYHGIGHMTQAQVNIHVCTVMSVLSEGCRGEVRLLDLRQERSHIECLRNGR